MTRIQSGKHSGDCFTSLAAVVVCMILVTVQLAFAQSSPKAQLKSPSNPGSSQERDQRLLALTSEADVIAVGKVGRLASEWNEDKTSIRTRVTISVGETIKGSVPGSSMTVFVPGGEVDGVGEWYSHSVQFVKEENVVVFANKGPQGRLFVTGGEHGKFSIKEEKISGSKMIPNVGTLGAFTAKIKNITKAQKADSRQ